METKMSKKLWFNILLFSLMGQIAWNVENMYFNTFLYNSVYAGASQTAVNGTISVVTAISRMVAFSAATAVITTFIMGTLSDKLRNRKLFISGGYVAWGAVTALFGFISRDNIASIFGLTDETKILTMTVCAVILMDCIMTFMGSTSNDSAFNAWVTDVTNPTVRPKVETALAILPILSTGIVMGIGTFAQVGTITYSMFFIGLGVFVIACGIAGFFLLEEPKTHLSNEIKVNYFKSLVYGFNPKVIKENSRFYLALICLCCTSIAFQVFFPYILVYLQYVILPNSAELNYLSISSILPILCGVIAAIVVMVVLMKKAAKSKKTVLLPCVLVFVVALAGLVFSHSIPLFLSFAAPAMAAYFVFSIQMSSSVRDFTPIGKAGAFQGIRMIFIVLIPMIVGPKLGELACLNSGITYLDDYGVQQIVPSSSMFAYSAIAAVCIIIPLIFLMKKGFEVENTDENIA